VSQEFPLRRSRWALPLLLPLAPGRIRAEVTPDRVLVWMGLLGRADVPLRLLDRVSRMEWPWWGGVGARLGRGLVAYVGASGPAAILELSEPVPVRAPMRWETRRVIVGVEDVEGFTAAVVAARREV
jgi:hypothetical protein